MGAVCPAIFLFLSCKLHAFVPIKYDVTLLASSNKSVLLMRRTYGHFFAARVYMAFKFEKKPKFALSGLDQYKLVNS